MSRAATASVGLAAWLGLVGCERSDEVPSVPSAATASAAVASVGPRATAPASSSAWVAAPASPPPTPATPLPAVVGRSAFAVAHPAAFDLVSLGPGVAGMVWLSGGRVRAQKVVGRGVVQGKPVTVASVSAASAVEELVAVFGAGRLGVAWRVRRAPAAVVEGTVGSLEDGAFDAPFELAATPAGAGRGGLAAASDASGRLVVLHRTGEVACHDDGAERCAGAAWSSIPPTPGVSRPRLAVPKPCDPLIAGVASLDGVWHYGVCSRDKARRATTLFSARPDPAYAQAVERLLGCRPAGISVVGPDAWLAGRCGPKRAAVRIRGTEVDRTMHDFTAAQIQCRGSAAHLRAGERRWPLDRPVSRLEPLLGATLPKGARAVWTGQALVVAYPDGGRVRLASSDCLRASAP